MSSAVKSITPSPSMGLIETTRTGSCFNAGSATPANVGTLCCASDLFCCSTGLPGRANTNSARNRPIEQKAKPVKKCGLKNADLETSFLFIRRIFSVVEYRPSYAGIRLVTEGENEKTYRSSDDGRSFCLATSRRIFQDRPMKTTTLSTNLRNRSL